MEQRRSIMQSLETITALALTAVIVYAFRVNFFLTPVAMLLLYGLSYPIRVLLCRRFPGRVETICWVRMAAIIGVLAVASAIYTRPTMLFKQYVASPIPASVEILNCDYFGFRDVGAHFHFRISPADFDALVAAHGLTLTGPCATCPATMCDGTPNPVLDPKRKFPIFLMDRSWWHPEDLQGPTLYRRDIVPPVANVEIWTNAAHTEVYFEYLSY